MATLTPTDISGRVVFLGLVHDRAVTLESAPVETMTLDWAGPVGECHAGLTRRSCSRVMLQHPKGTEIRNTRQLSMVSVEDLAAVAQAMDAPRIAPEWTGANIMFEGIPDFTLLPPSSRLIFANGAALVVDVENGPCRFVGEVIERHYPGKGGAFPRLAAGLRGVLGWVERPGVVALGDVARLHIPPQRLYAHAGRARAAE